MRIRAVTIEGFGPFESKQFVNFRAFDTDGLFLIAGETGVGKSSILDAIAYALYNKTPRWDNVSATGASNAVRSDFCGPDDVTEVIVEFETNGNEYRITRSPEYERPKARGGGMTTQGSKILVELLEGDRWVGKAARERDAAELIEGLVKLTKDEFLQVIMLAQGRFQEFLLADSSKRLELLSKLFGTERFKDYQLRIVQRRSLLSKDLETARTKQSALVSSIAAPEEIGAAGSGAEVEWLGKVIEHARGEEKSARKAAADGQAAEKAALDRVDLARRLQRRKTAESALVVLRKSEQAVLEAKVTLLRAERAERVRPLLDVATEQAGVVVNAQAQVDAARSRYDGEAPDDELGAATERLSGLIGTLADALEDERRAAQATADLANRTTQSNAVAAKVVEMTGSIATLHSEREKLVPTAALLPSSQETVERAESRFAAASEAVRLTERLKAAQVAQLVADQQLTTARVTADEVLRHLLRGQAGALAKNLVEGEPCQVCGSLEHPQPARISDDAMSQDDVDAAQGAVSRLEPAATQARARVDDFKVKAAKLAGVAGETNLETLSEEVNRAHELQMAALEAGKRVGQIDQELQGVGGLLARLTRLEVESKESATALTRLRVEVDSLTKKLTRLRGNHSSVNDRYESLVEERDSAKQLSIVIRVLAEAEQQRSGTSKKLAAKLLAEKFDSGAEVADALLDEAEIRELQARIDQHFEAVSENQGILKQPDLQGLPDEIVPVEEAEALHRGCQEAARSATSSTATAEAELGRLINQSVELESLLSATRDLADEYNIVNRLAETVSGRTPNTKNMALESYYIAAELEEVLSAANGRLSHLSNGRFEFRHTERGVRRSNASAGLEIEVFDEYTGTARPANQLSGGQQFLASLALALGLAEVVTSRAGGIELNTLFIDEGFGSLSSEYLEIAMETLDALKQGGRTVGVISHVSSMQEQIGAQVRVVAAPGGPSTVTQDAVNPDAPGGDFQHVA